MNEITTWELRFGARSLIQHAGRNPGRFNDRTLPAAGINTDVVAVARVNHSSWIVDCPFCGGAEFASFDRPTFFCCCCRNAQTDYQPIPVTLPAANVRDQIEALLLKRPNPDTRNWTVDETADALQAENVANGVDA